MRIDTQKQTLSARDESIKKLLEMLQNKGEGEMKQFYKTRKRERITQKEVFEIDLVSCF